MHALSIRIKFAESHPFYPVFGPSKRSIPECPCFLKRRHCVSAQSETAALTTWGWSQQFQNTKSQDWRRDGQGSVICQDRSWTPANALPLLLGFSLFTRMSPQPSSNVLRIRFWMPDCKTLRLWNRKRGLNRRRAMHTGSVPFP